MYPKGMNDMSGLMDMIGNRLNVIERKRNEAHAEVVFLNAVRIELAMYEMDLARAAAKEAQAIERRAALMAYYPEHEDILVNANGDAVAHFCHGEWVYKNHDDAIETRGGFYVRQQYYDRVTDTAEWTVDLFA